MIPGEREAERLHLPAEGGPVAIRPARSADTHAIRTYQEALHQYVTTGELTKLRRLAVRTVTDVDGTEYPLIVDPSMLRRLAEFGLIDFDWDFE
jgi:hypothetical protein